MNTKDRGVFIVFEGIDGTGKSTQIGRLADALRNDGYEVVATREPTEGRYGRKIRSLYLNRDSISPEEELDLFIQDRREHVRELIRPSLESGKIVLCDRYFLSTAAYQGAAGLDPDKIVAMHDFAPAPDLAVIIEVDPRLCVRRITEARGDDLNDFEQFESLKKVDSIFKQMELPYIRRVDGSGPEEQVQARIHEMVSRLLHSEP